MKMCSISVEPMPSMTSTPKWRVKRSPISAGRASPAEDASRNATASRGGSVGDASMPARPVGAPKKMVGFTPRTPPMRRLNVASGVGRSAISSTEAPTLIGNVSAFPSPYAKNSLAAEKHTSVSRMPRMGFA
jgi:hypothetical protein